MTVFLPLGDRVFWDPECFSVAMGHIVIHSLLVSFNDVIKKLN